MAHSQPNRNASLDWFSSGNLIKDRPNGQENFGENFTAPTRHV